ncbi:hypothetical protein TrVE_jg8440 [Triparma verrucosa]|uniref:Elongation of fatty acids protein n=1 Tax=Triparma verrucosa TaxID=1606542 RepID=A0A9W7BXV7_9STRA|nr:hypothetical protein TrVE_jg8440 [Triparma verrucosa]
MSSYLEMMRNYEASWDTAKAIEYTGEHTEIPVFAISLYLLIVFYIPEHIKTGLPLRSLWAYWNLLLSVFSIIGAYRCVPYLISHLLEHGFTYTTCHDSTKWFLRHDEPNPVGFWVTLFIYSKIPELVDTVFLVLQKKPVIFLHWFHHVTVLLYCWHAFANWTASGLWFVSMNFTVHSIMYFYYFLAIAGYKSLAKPMAPLITTIQLVQMIVGSIVMINVWNVKKDGGECFVIPANYKLGLAMYLSYFCLFAVLFYNLYLKEGGKHAKKTKKGSKKDNDDDTLCGVDMKKGDAAGFFHTQSDKEKLKKK